MRKQAIAIAIASALTFVGSAFAQQQMEAVVTVTKFDPASRIVWVEAKDAKRELHLSPDIDMSALQVGSRYQVRWTEGVATAIEPGAQAAAAGATREVDITKTGPGMSTASSQRTGVVDSIDADAKKITLRTLDGQTETFSLGANVAPGSFKTGDTVTLTYERSLASQVRSTPQPVSSPAPAQ
jgi:Cu/Ag efflux protein CusF